MEKLEVMNGYKQIIVLSITKPAGWLVSPLGVAHHIR